MGLTKHGGIIPTKLDFKLNSRRLMAMVKTMEITNLHQIMLMVYRPPTSPNQARLHKASQAPNLSTKTSCNLNLKRWHSSLHLKKFARLWVSSFSKRMPILLRKRKTSFAMLCLSMKSCQNLKSSSSQTGEASEKSKDFGDCSLPLMLSSLASGICTRQRKLIRMQ